MSALDSMMMGLFNAKQGVQNAQSNLFNPRNRESPTTLTPQQKSDDMFRRWFVKTANQPTTRLNMSGQQEDVDQPQGLDYLKANDHTGGHSWEVNQPQREAAGRSAVADTYARQGLQEQENKALQQPGQHQTPYGTVERGNLWDGNPFTIEGAPGRDWLAAHGNDGGHESTANALMKFMSDQGMHGDELQSMGDNAPNAVKNSGYQLPTDSRPSMIANRESAKKDSLMKSNHDSTVANLFPETKENPFITPQLAHDKRRQDYIKSQSPTMAAPFPTKPSPGFEPQQKSQASAQPAGVDYAAQAGATPQANAQPNWLDKILEMLFNSDPSTRNTRHNMLSGATDALTHAGSVLPRF